MSRFLSACELQQKPAQPGCCSSRADRSLNGALPCAMRAPAPRFKVMIDLHPHPSNLASGRTYRTSSPLAIFHDSTTPPNRYTCAADPCRKPQRLRQRVERHALKLRCDLPQALAALNDSRLPNAIFPSRLTPLLTSTEAPHECCRCTMGRPPRPALTSTCSGMPNLALSASTSAAVSAAAAHRTASLRRATARLAVLLASCLAPPTNGRTAVDAAARQLGGVLWRSRPKVVSCGPEVWIAIHECHPRSVRRSSMMRATRHKRYRVI